MSGADILLGQPAIASPGVKMTIEEKKVHFSKPSEECQIAAVMQMGDHQPVTVQRDVSIAPGAASLVPVDLPGARIGDNFGIMRRTYGFGNAVIKIVNGWVTCAHQNELAVQNVGVDDWMLKKSFVITWLKALQSAPKSFDCAAMGETMFF